MLRPDTLALTALLALLTAVGPMSVDFYLPSLPAFGVAAAAVLARAMVRDLYHGVRAGRELARMGSITALAPIVAPSLGGVLQTMFGWRAAFIAMAGLSLGVIVLVIRLLPETM